MALAPAAPVQPAASTVRALPAPRTPLALPPGPSDSAVSAIAASASDSASAADSVDPADETSPWFDRRRALGCRVPETDEPSHDAAVRIAAAEPGAETPDEARSPEVRAFPWFGAAEP